MTTIGLLDLGTRVLHVGSGVHGIGLCGVHLDTYRAARLDLLIDQADHLCEECLELGWA